MNVEKYVLKKIRKFTKQSIGEVGGLLLGETKDGDIKIVDAILLKQKVSSGAFLIDDKAMMDFTKEASSKKLSSIVGWWHSHANSNTFWSFDDDDTFKRLCDFFQNKMCIGVVVNKKHKIRWKTVIKLNECYMDFDNIQPTITNFFGWYNKNEYYNDFKNRGLYEEECIPQFEQEFNEKVEVDESVTLVKCPQCKGKGYIESMNIKGVAKKIKHQISDYVG